MTDSDPRNTPWTAPDGYLDSVAGQPLLGPARLAWEAAAERSWSDPARLHHEGRQAGLILDAARASVAAYFEVRSTEVYFTSSGPTACAVAANGLLTSGRGRRAVVGAVESMAVTSAVRPWADEVQEVPVDRLGRIDMDAFEQSLVRTAALACVQVANGEVGTRQPLAEAHAAARAAGVPLLAHAVQVVGRTAVSSHWDVLAASARDWAGPAGVGVLIVREGVPWRPEANERGWVGGFPDIPGAAAAATALEVVAPLQQSESARAFGLVEELRTRLPLVDAGIRVAGDPVDRLPHIVTFTVDGVVGEALVHELARRGLSVASGSACTSDVRMPSQVLEAMGMRADASIRVSLPYGCTEATVERLLAELPASLAAARA